MARTYPTLSNTVPTLRTGLQLLDENNARGRVTALNDDGSFNAWFPKTRHLLRTFHPVGDGTYSEHPATYCTRILFTL